MATVVAVQAPDAIWTPTSQQSFEPDTTFMLDPAQDAALGLTPGFGGLVDRSGGAATPNTIAGKFLQGYQPSATSGSYMWMPFDGVLGVDQHTVEFWAQLNADWHTFSSALTFLTLGSPNNFIDLAITATGTMRLRVSHFQNPAALGVNGYSVEADYSFGSGLYLANTWYSVAWTLKGGALTLFVGGTQVAQVSSVVSPGYWGTDAHSDGLWLPSDNASHTSTALQISDLRVGRQARTLTARALVAVERSVVTVTNTAGSTTVQPLNGILHSVPNLTADSEQQSLGFLQSVRMDKWMSVTPTVAGGTDATHPTAGHSGSFSYDWQIADRTAAYYVSTLGLGDIYITVGGNVPVTGSTTTAPFTNVAATTTAAAQTPDISGTLNLVSVAGIPAGAGWFTYGGNVYKYTSVDGSGIALNGVVLAAGMAPSTPSLSIPGGSTVNVGLLTFGYAWQTSYDASVPNSFTNNAKVWADLAYRLTVEKGYSVPYWSVTNEPDSTTWAGTLPQWLLYYQALASAIKGVSASLKVGGPSISTWLSSGWVQALIYFCGTLPAPTGVAAAAQVGGGTFNGSTTRFYKAVYRNGSGNSVGSNEVSATPVLNGSVLLTLPYQPGATTIDIYAATSTGGQTGATSLLVSGLTAGNQASVTYTDTGAALTTGAIPASATASGVALDFISWHYFSGDISEPYQVRIQTDAWLTIAGLATGKALSAEEWNWQGGNYRSPWQQTGATPTDYIRNDFSAGFMAASMIQMQANGVVRSHSCDEAAVGGGSLAALHYPNADHMFDLADGHLLASANVARLWSLITDNTVYSSSGPNTVACDPGIQALWSKNGASPKTVGGITIPANAVCLLIANLHYRKVKHDGTAKNAPVLIKGIPVADGTAVTAYVVDDQHSNAYDAGLSNASLRTTSTNLNAQGVNKVSGGQVGIVLRPRAAALLVIG